MKLLVFNQNFDNYSLVCIYWTYCLRNLHNSFEPLIPWIWLTPHFLVFRDIHILITNWCSISIPKTSSRVERGWIMSQDVFFQKSLKDCWRQQKYHMKIDQTHNIWKQQQNSFSMRGYSSTSGKWFFWRHIWRCQEISAMPYKNSQAGKFCDIARKCVKLNIRKWRVIAGVRPAANFELSTKNLRR